MISMDRKDSIYAVLIDLALDTRDREWFKELILRREQDQERTEEIYEDFISGKLKSYGYRYDNNGLYIFVTDDVNTYQINLHDFYIYCNLRLIHDKNNKGNKD